MPPVREGSIPKVFLERDEKITQKLKRENKIYMF